jgi:predicted transcriptional regulator
MKHIGAEKMKREKTEFQKCLKRARQSLYLTQKDFAERLNIPLSTYKSWESSGLCLPSFDNFLNLTKYLYNHNHSDRVANAATALKLEYNKRKEKEQ